MSNVEDQAKLISTLQERVSSLEESKTFAATQADVQKVQMEMLEKLRTVREVVTNESKGGGGGGAAVAELDALREENAALKKRNAKNEYRIKHLVRSVNELQSDLKGKQ